MDTLGNNTHHRARIQVAERESSHWTATQHRHGIRYNARYATQSFLDVVHSPRAHRRSRPAILLGGRCHYSRGHAGVVDRLPFRLVLAPGTTAKVSRKSSMDVEMRN